MDAHTIALVVAAVGGLVLLLGLLSGFLHNRTPFSEPLLALLAGVLLGPAVSGVLDPAPWGDRRLILQEASRLTLAVGLMAVALRLPPGFILQQRRALLLLVGVLMPLMCLAGGALAWAVLGLPFLLALLLGAILTPTDPIVATSIVTGKLAEKNLPQRLRHTLSAESGINDGLAYPLVMLPILLLVQEPGAAFWGWLLRAVLWQIGGAVVFGLALGYAAGRLLLWGESHGTAEKTSFLAYTVALSLLALGAARLLGTEGVLAVFVAGVGFAMTVGGHERAAEEGVQEAVSQFFTLPIFALLGLYLPWSGWAELGWRGLLLAALVLALRRLPFVLLLKPLTPPLPKARDALFYGWFGPLGVAALLYLGVALEHTAREEVWAAGSLVVCASLLAHGMTATPLTRLYGGKKML